MQDIRVTAGSSTYLPFLMVLASDHRTPAIGASPVVHISQNAGAFNVPQTDVIEIANGWYALAGGNPTTGVIGPLLLHATAVGADVVDARFEIVPFAGASPCVINSNRYPLTFLMVQGADHLTGAAGLSPTVTIAKVGTAFGAPAGAVAEIGGASHGLGWYFVTANPIDTSTPGPLLLHATAAGADITDERYDVAGLFGNNAYKMGPALLAIKALLVNSGMFTNSSCIVSAAREPFPNPSPPCCAIAPGRFNTDGGMLTGGGRYETEVEGDFVVKVILRHMKDIATQDLIFYTDTSDGGYKFIEDIVNVLCEQFLFDPLGTMLTTAGLKPAGIGEPMMYKDPMYVMIPVTFRARVLLGPTVPDPN